MRIIFNLITAIVSGIFYRIGGSQYYNTLFRDMGVPAMIVGALWPHDLIMWIGAMLTFGATWGVLSMGYGGEGEPKEDQSFLYRTFGKNVFVALGFLYGLSALPWAVVTCRPWRFLARLVILTVLIPVWEKNARAVWKFDKAQVQEWGRGFLINVTCLLL